MISDIYLDDDRQLKVAGGSVTESSDEPIRRKTFRKPGRQECADWEAQLNQAILTTDIREGWEGFVELFVVQIERFELKESVVAESGETRST